MRRLLCRWFGHRPPGWNEAMMSAPDRRGRQYTFPVGVCPRCKAPVRLPRTGPVLS